MPMPSRDTTSTTSSSSPTATAERGLMQYVYTWGENPLPPTVTATLITALHMQPFQALPMLFPPILLFSSYLNVNGFKKDSAGLTSAWSAAYMVLAQRRTQPLRRRFGARGVVRGATLALCAANVAAGGWVYAFGQRQDEDES